MHVDVGYGWCHRLHHQHLSSMAALLSRASVSSSAPTLPPPPPSPPDGYRHCLNLRFCLPPSTPPLPLPPPPPAAACCRCRHKAVSLRGRHECRCRAQLLVQRHCSTAMAFSNYYLYLPSSPPAPLTIALGCARSLWCCRERQCRAQLLHSPLSLANERRLQPRLCLGVELKSLMAASSALHETTVTCSISAAQHPTTKRQQPPADGSRRNSSR